MESLFSARERALLALATLALVVAVGAIALRAEVRERKEAFGLEAHNASLQVLRRLAEGQTLITALHGFYQSAGDVSSATFPGVAANFLHDHPQVRWMAFAEHVPIGTEDAFERRMHTEGFVGLRVQPLPGAPALRGNVPRLAIRQIEPLFPDIARFLGADIASRTEWIDALQGAIDSGEVRALDSSAHENGMRGFLLLRATYLGHVEPDTVEDRRRQLAGMLMVLLDPDELIGNISTAESGLRVEFVHGLVDKHHPSAEEPHLAGVRPFDGWAPRLVSEPMIALADRQVHLAIVAPLTPQVSGVTGSMLLAALLALSLLQGLRVRRAALRQERSAYAQAQLAEITLHSIGEAVIRLDERGRVRYLNPVAEEIVGRPEATVQGRRIERVLRLRQGSGKVLTAATLADSDLDDGPLLIEEPGGRRRAVACTLSPIVDDAGQGAGRVLILRDVSREHELSRELAYQAAHDPLTELPNRREFERRLARAIAEAHSGTCTHCVLYVDLDQFKLVNDTCGHAAGDQMLRQIAGLLASEVRERDVLARLGGDEFGVLLAGCPVDRAMPIAERICQVVAAFRFVWNHRAFELGASIGVVEVGRECGTIDDVQRAADLACYAAKDTGRNRVHLFRHEDRVISRNHREMQWHVEIKQALDQGRFVLHAQEIRRLNTEARPLRMRELLLRMVDGDGALVPPMAFLPAAERYGLMTALDRFVVDHAFDHVAAAAVADEAFTINLSGQSLADPALGDFIVEAARRTGVSPAQVCFEVTETSAISNLNQAVQLMERLRSFGFRFALDDFGAGVSSFGYLKQLPVDFLKIDGQFVREINDDAVARAMVASIISVARVLSLKTIAEKVEDESAERCLQALGADYVQGYLVGRPQPIGRSLPLACSA